jgi:hypothetical protein
MNACVATPERESVTRSNVFTQIRGEAIRPSQFKCCCGSQSRAPLTALDAPDALQL